MLLYRALAAAALFAYAPWALLRALAGRRRLGDLRGRLGKSPYPDLGGGVWLHAVSVGEIGVVRNLLPALRRQLPDCPIGVSVTTAAGRELAERVLSSEASVFAFPFDLDGPVGRALSRVHPGLVLLTETEIWPLFIQRASRRGIKVALVNGRISARSFRGYRLIRRWFASTLGRIALFAMQSPEDALRIEALGAPPERIRVLGNIKYDLPAAPPFSDAERLRRAAGGRDIWVAGSIGDGEEELVLEALARLERRPLLVLAPRRPERFEPAAQLASERGWNVLRRSSRPTVVASPPDVYLLDSIGELAGVYRGASVAFVGGSLIPRGGQNPIEAWASSVPVIVGPHMDNFREIAARGERLGILRRVPDAAGLARELAASLASPAETARRGEDAARFVAENRGAAERTAQAVVALASATAGRRASAP